MDRTRAKALEIAERKLIALGYRFSLEEIGKSADAIIAAMEKAADDRAALTAKQTDGREGE